jgi:hypothetical protein
VLKSLQVASATGSGRREPLAAAAGAQCAGRPGRSKPARKGLSLKGGSELPSRWGPQPRSPAWPFFLPVGYPQGHPPLEKASNCKTLDLSGCQGDFPKSFVGRAEGIYPHPFRGEDV